MSWPQYVYLALMFLGLGINLKEHGQPKTGKHSFQVQLTGACIALWLLWCGGFFGGAL